MMYKFKPKPNKQPLNKYSLFSFLFSFLFIFLFLFSISTSFLHATINSIATRNIITTENEFIKITVNNEFLDQGRFAIDTTNGNPENPSDNKKSLIYGKPIPWTSYTSLLIDNKDYIFGGLSKKTLKRSGKKSNFGNLISQESNANGIETTCTFNQINVTQTLSFYKNPITKINDSTLIEYQITNNDSIPHSIGLRIMLDTKLGLNDGAPFRIGNQSVTTEQKFEKKELFDYWQTFDNLSSPNIIAQGTIKLGSTITPPDKMFLTNWGSLSDNPWDYTIQENKSFIREGELEKDTALALYWNPIPLKPGETRTIRTLYGLGGITRAPGELSLGLTAPGELYQSNKDEFLIMGYISNTGGFDSQNTILSFKLPKGFSIINKSKKFKLNLLKTNETKQIPIKVKLKNPKAGLHHITLSATSSTVENNKISRKIDILSPPNLITALHIPATHTLNKSNYFDARLKIKNTTNQKINNITTGISLPDDFSLPNFEIPKKHLKSLNPNESKEINWKIKIKETTPSKLSNTIPIIKKISTVVTSSLTKTKNDSSKITLSKAPEKVLFFTSHSRLIKDNYLFIQLAIQNPLSSTKEYSISYDPNSIKLIRFTKDLTLLYKESYLDINKENQSQIGIITTLPPHKTPTSYFPIIKLHFKAISTGSTDILLKENNELINIIPLSISNLTLNASLN